MNTESFIDWAAIVQSSNSFGGLLPISISDCHTALQFVEWMQGGQTTTDIQLPVLPIYFFFFFSDSGW